MACSSIVVFTERYPLGGQIEEAFVRPELSALSRSFAHVYLVPAHAEGPAIQGWKVSENIEIIESYSAKHVYNVSRLKIAAGVIFKGLPLSKRVEVRRKLEYRRFCKWADNFLGDKMQAGVLLYTFWLAHDAEYVGRYAAEHQMFAVSRAHRYDIFDIHQSDFRRKALAGFRMIFPCSEDGREALRKTYPELADRFDTAYLGVPVPKCMNPPQNDNKDIVFFSCHNLHSRKRGVLCAQVLLKLAVRLPGRRIRWILVGDGPDRENILATVKKVPSNFNFDYRGFMPNDRVREIYATEPIDFAILLSESEGLAVMEQEALSFGIPVISTDVGGARECVTGQTGVLLPSDVTPEHAASRIEQALPQRREMRSNAYKMFLSKFKGEQNRDIFVSKILRHLK